MGAGKSLSGQEKNRAKKRKVSFLTFLGPNFFLDRLDFFPSPLTAPGSPRMGLRRRLPKYMQEVLPRLFGRSLLKWGLYQGAATSIWCERTRVWRGISKTAGIGKNRENILNYQDLFYTGKSTKRFNLPGKERTLTGRREFEHFTPLGCQITSTEHLISKQSVNWSMCFCGTPRR